MHTILEEQILSLLEPCRQHGLVQFHVANALPKPSHHDTALAIATPLSQFMQIFIHKLLSLAATALVCRPNSGLSAESCHLRYAAASCNTQFLLVCTIILNRHPESHQGKQPNGNA